MVDALDFARPIFFLCGCSFIILDAFIYRLDKFMFNMPFSYRFLYFVACFLADILLIACFASFYIVGTFNGLLIGLSN